MEFPDPAESEEPLATDDVAHRAQENSAGQRDELFRRVGPAVYAWARIHLRGPLRARLDPEDVLQEVTCRALQNLAGWDAGKGSFRSFVFGIAKNVLRKGLERAVREPSVQSAQASYLLDVDAALRDTATTFTRAVARDESFAAMMQHIESLDDEDCRLLLHRGLEGLSHECVAEMFNISPEAAMKRWQRLREQLRSEPRFLELVAV